MPDKSSLRTTKVQSSLFDPSSINNASELLYTINQFSNAGDRIELCFAFAQNRLDVALHSFATILNTNADRKIRALVLRSCGEILHPPTRREIKACQTQESRELLRFLAEEASGKSQYSSDLTQWAAATAIIQLGYDLNVVQYVELGGLQEEPDRIREKIVERRIEQGRRLDRYNTRNALSSEYREYLEFWAYGPTKVFFSEPSYHYGSADIRHILAFLQIHGLTLAFDPSSNQQAQSEAYSFAKQLFQEYLNTKEPWLNESLKRFVASNFNYDDDFALIKLAEAIIFNHAISLPQSKYLTENELLNETNKVREYVAELSSLFSDAILVCNNSILTKWIISDYTKYLQDTNRKLAGNVTHNLKVNYSNTYKLTNLTKSELLQERDKVQEYLAYIAEVSSLFSTAISICSSSTLTEWITSDYNESRQILNNWLTELDSVIKELEQMQSKIATNCKELNRAYNQIKGIDRKLDKSLDDLHTDDLRFVAIIPESKLKDEDRIKTLNNCNQYMFVLNSRRESFTNICNRRKGEIKDSIDSKEDNPLGFLSCGIVILIISIYFGSVSFGWWLISLMGLTLMIVPSYLYISKRIYADKVVPQIKAILYKLDALWKL